MDSPEATSPHHEGQQPVAHFPYENTPIDKLRARLEDAGASMKDCERLTQECGIPASYCAQFFTDFQRIREGIHQAFDHLAAFQQFAAQNAVPPHAAISGYFCVLPDELIVYILCYLHPTSIAVMKRTCKFFRKLTDDESLWRAMYLKRWDPPRDITNSSHHSKKARRSWKQSYMTHALTDQNWYEGRRRLANTFLGHTGTVYCLQFDDEKVVTGSTDSHLKIWDLPTGRCRATLEGHEARIRCLKYDQHRIVSGSVDTTIKIWDLASLKNVHTLRGHTKYVYCVQFDDTKIVSGSGDRTVKIWDLGTGVCLNTIQTGGVGVQCVGDAIVTGSMEKTIKMWDLRTNTCIKTIDRVHENDIWCLEVRGNTIASGSKDTTIKLWDIGTGKRLHTFDGHKSSILTLQMDNRKLVSGSRDETIRVWDMHSAQCLYQYDKEDLGIVWCVAFDDTRLLAGSNRRYVKMWDYYDLPSDLAGSEGATSSSSSLNLSNASVVTNAV